MAGSGNGRHSLPFECGIIFVNQHPLALVVRRHYKTFAADSVTGLYYSHGNDLSLVRF